MASNDYLGLQMFKRFKEYTEFEWSSITLLTGKNNSGKSSVIEALKICASAFSKSNRTPNNLNGLSTIHLSDIEDKTASFQNLVHNRGSLPLTFSMPITLKGINDKFHLRLSYCQDKFVPAEGSLTKIEIESHRLGKNIVTVETDKKWIAKVDYGFFLDAFQAESKIFKEYYQLQVEVVEIIRNEMALLDNNMELTDDACLTLFRYYDNLEGINTVQRNRLEQIRTTFELEYTQFWNELNLLSNTDNVRYIESYQPFFDRFFYQNKFQLFDPEKPMFYWLVNGNAENSELMQKIKQKYKDDDFSVAFMKETLDYFSRELVVPFEPWDIFNGVSEDEMFYDDGLKFITLNFLFKKHEGEFVPQLFRKFNLRDSDLLGYIIDGVDNFLSLSYGGKRAWGETFLSDFIHKNILDGIINATSEFSRFRFIRTYRNKATRGFSIKDFNSDIERVASAFLRSRTKYSEVVNAGNRYLKILGIADSFDISWSANGLNYVIELNKNGIKRPIEDEGFGVGQVLPIIFRIVVDALSRVNPFDSGLELHYMRDSTICIEEPETNLHPNLQSKLADIFIDANKRFGVNFIIETHSEYLIRKLQYLVAKKEVYSSSLVLYYVNSADDEITERRSMRRIRFNNDGSLSDSFGEGFFDEAAKLKFDLLDLTVQQKN